MKAEIKLQAQTVGTDVYMSNVLDTLNPTSQSYLERIGSMVQEYEKVAYNLGVLNTRTSSASPILGVRYSDTFRVVFAETLMEEADN